MIFLIKPKKLLEPMQISSSHSRIHSNTITLSRQEPRLSRQTDHRLRQNYILKKHHNSTIEDTSKIKDRPQLIKFIPIKPSIHTQTALNKLKIIIQQQNNRKPIKRRPRYMRLRRPQHNSPMQVRYPQKFIKAKESKDNSQQKTRQGNSEVNDIILNQLVTQVQQRASRTARNPYVRGSLYFVTGALKFYKEQGSAMREYLLDCIYFLELMAHYNNTPLYSQNKPIFLPQKPQYQDKITVVLDLDETLVHCYQQPDHPHDVSLQVKFHSGSKTIAPINIRPNAKKFLQAIAKQFQVIIFTASNQMYADAVVDYFDPKKQLIQHRLYRRHCDYIQQGYYIKDLRILGRDLSQVVLVDNAAYSYAFQVDNGIPITPFFSGQDFELNSLQEYLFSLKGHEDVRQANRIAFRQAEYTKYTTVEEVVQNLYKKH